MPKANLYDMAGKQIGEVELSEAIFGIEPTSMWPMTWSRTTWPTAVRALSLP